MKKAFVLFALVFVLVLTQIDAFAQEVDEQMKATMGKEMVKCTKMAEHKEMEKCKESMMCIGMTGCMMGSCPMHGMMMEMMMAKSVYATEDGGVLLMVGNRLLKYDKKLNLINEVEISMDMEKMQSKMMQMMKNCPMCKKMMGGEGIMDKPMEKMKETEESEKKSGHEGHH